MSDIWSGIGVEIKGSEGEWLFRVGGEIHGPVPLNIIANKLLNGQIAVDTMVAMEGGEFHPVLKVAAFAPHVKRAKELASKRSAKKSRRILLVFMLFVLGGGGVAGYFVFQKYQSHEKQAVADAKKLADEKRAKNARIAKLGGDMELVAVVSLGSEDEVKFRSSPKPKTPRGRKPKGKKGSTAESDRFVSSCTRGRGEILGTLGRYVGKLNFCVVEEKKRDKAGLMPSTLAIEFVVRPDGRVSDFSIPNRHYRTGIMKNCMQKVFNMVRYPSASGSNCPVTLPLKIGN